MKKILLIILLFSTYMMGQDIPIIGDTTDLKSHTKKQMVILQQFGGGDETGGGLFRRIDSTYAEGTHAFDYAGLDGLQWVRMQYMGGEMGAFTDLSAVTLTVSGLTTTTGGYLPVAQTVYPTNAVVADSNVIAVGVTVVDVGDVGYDSDDFIVLPAIGSVPVGYEIIIVGNSDGDFELRTVAASGTKINNVDGDGDTKEYLVTDANTVFIHKVSDAYGWTAHDFDHVGAIVAAHVPD
jgi:hypothetical protein